MAPIKQAQQQERIGGILIVEEFRDYRFLKASPPQRDDINKSLNRLFFSFPGGGFDHHNPAIGTAYDENDNRIGQPITAALAKAVVQDFKERKWFDEVSYQEANGQNLHGEWRLIALIHQMDETIRFHGYYLPVIPSYFYILGAPFAQTIDDVTLEIKFENLKTKETVFQKKISRHNVSKNYNEYSWDYGTHGWNIGYYELAKTIRSIMDEYSESLRKELGSYAKT